MQRFSERLYSSMSHRLGACRSLLTSETAKFWFWSYSVQIGAARFREDCWLVPGMICFAHQLLAERLASFTRTCLPAVLKSSVGGRSTNAQNWCSWCIGKDHIATEVQVRYSGSDADHSTELYTYQIRWVGGGGENLREPPLTIWYVWASLSFPGPRMVMTAHYYTHPSPKHACGEQPTRYIATCPAGSLAPRRRKQSISSMSTDRESTSCMAIDGYEEQDLDTRQTANGSMSWPNEPVRTCGIQQHSTPSSIIDPSKGHTSWGGQAPQPWRSPFSALTGIASAPDEKSTRAGMRQYKGETPCELTAAYSFLIPVKHSIGLPTSSKESVRRPADLRFSHNPRSLCIADFGSLDRVGYSTRETPLDTKKKSEEYRGYAKRTNISTRIGIPAEELRRLAEEHRPALNTKLSRRASSIIEAATPKFDGQKLKSTKLSRRASSSIEAATPKLDGYNSRVQSSPEEHYPALENSNPETPLVAGKAAKENRTAFHQYLWLWEKQLQKKIRLIGAPSIAEEVAEEGPAASTTFLAIKDADGGDRTAFHQQLCASAGSGAGSGCSCASGTGTGSSSGFGSDSGSDSYRRRRRDEHVLDAKMKRRRVYPSSGDERPLPESSIKDKSKAEVAPARPRAGTGTPTRKPLKPIAAMQKESPGRGVEWLTQPRIFGAGYNNKTLSTTTRTGTIDAKMSNATKKATAQDVAEEPLLVEDSMNLHYRINKVKLKSLIEAGATGDPRPDLGVSIDRNKCLGDQGSTLRAKMNLDLSPTSDPFESELSLKTADGGVCNVLWTFRTLITDLQKRPIGI
ncbi:uncharacterized protein MYCFIDRAFT_180502 [Pseudocercospora fijiensis CIRAD86]|uniref:Uncharacterized protein n=1 Tax=Pseudocercospora fijiensis (strain CIRAD86) TaxID=383855 RepID=M2YGS8_PSEFD|nr:uncharacterized protein MYCFIDRAFT_180502 [Pseudocercospora fijiensis CIRAD86]EME77015.1 hypothetical protein MYCFIDRAFT_180502 [Pseudocercospora fijiensis CIRAD86]